MKKTEDEKTPPIIIKKIKKGGGGHHGGAWKVAYADFVTAMMAFFLLLWLLNVTTDEQKFAISNYFDPTFPKVSNVESGSGGVMGGTTVAKDGAMTSTVQPISQPPIPDKTTKKEGQEDTQNRADMSTEQAEEIARKAEEERFKEVENQIRQSVESNEDLKALTDNLIMDITEEGLRIQVVDQDKEPMFPSGSAQMFEKTRKLLMLVSKAVKDMPNKLSVRGHTDSTPYPEGSSYDNWDLSAERANSSRRALLAGGTPPARISNVLGKADVEPLDKANPMAPINRRISIVVLREPKLKAPAAERVQRRSKTAVPGRWDDGKERETEPRPQRQGRPYEDTPKEPYKSGGGVLGLP